MDLHNRITCSFFGNLKPLGHRAYGSIPHLPGSRRGPADKGLGEAQAAICTTKARAGDQVFVQEKLDGSCCAVAKLNGEILALNRRGYLATSSPFEQHQMFARWVRRHEYRFGELLYEGMWCCGEWLAQAHSTKYELTHEPYVIFDIFRKKSKSGRMTFNEVCARCSYVDFVVPSTFTLFESITIADAMSWIGMRGFHGADMAEGAVWRVERGDVVDFLAKYVRPEKEAGLYLPEISGKDAVWNWTES